MIYTIKIKVELLKEDYPCETYKKDYNQIPIMDLVVIFFNLPSFSI